MIPRAYIYEAAMIYLFPSVANQWDAATTIQIIILYICIDKFAVATVILNLLLILILSVCTDFLPLEFDKIQIFLFKIEKIQIFSRNATMFPLYFFSYTDFFPKNS